jgi:putative DNA primase/helicase
MTALPSRPTPEAVQAALAAQKKADAKDITYHAFSAKESSATFARLRNLKKSDLAGSDSSPSQASGKADLSPATNDADTPFDDVEPWPSQVDLGEVLDEITATIHRHIICDKHTAHAAALWIVMTYFVQIFDIAALLILTSPEMRCGKSDFKRLIAKMVLRPLEADGMSAPVLFRGFDLWNPTLIIDEYDTFVKDDEDLRGVFNSGHQRGGCIWRCVGKEHTPTRFNVFGAKVLAGIGRLAPTVMDRAIILPLRRKLSTETVKRLRDVPKKYFQDIQSKLARAALDYENQIADARPTLPDELSDRAADNWEPLFQIAQVIGGEWLTRARAAALKLSGQKEDVKTVGVELLSDIQDAFASKNTDRISSAELIKILCEDDEKRWATYNKGFPITQSQIAKRLRDYEITSGTIRVHGSTAKGYYKKDFEDSFERYLSDSTVKPAPDVTTSQVNKDEGYSVTPVLRVTDAGVTRHNAVTPEAAHSLGCDGVTDKAPEGEFSL